MCFFTTNPPFYPLCHLISLRPYTFLITSHLSISLSITSRHFFFLDRFRGSWFSRLCGLSLRIRFFLMSDDLFLDTMFISHNSYIGTSYFAIWGPVIKFSWTFLHFKLSNIFNQKSSKHNQLFILYIYNIIYIWYVVTVYKK